MGLYELLQNEWLGNKGNVQQADRQAKIEMGDVEARWSGHRSLLRSVPNTFSDDIHCCFCPTSVAIVSFVAVGCAENIICVFTMLNIS